MFLKDEEVTNLEVYLESRGYSLNNSCRTKHVASFLFYTGAVLYSGPIKGAQFGGLPMCRKGALQNPRKHLSPSSQKLNPRSQTTNPKPRKGKAYLRPQPQTSKLPLQLKLQNPKS